MDRNTVLRWVIIAAGVVLFMKFLYPKFSGESANQHQPIPAEHYVNAPGFIPDVLDTPGPGEQHPKSPPEGELCTIQGDRFHAELSSRGAGIKHFRLEGHYGTTQSGDLSTTPDHERWRSLRTMFRAEGANDQVRYDRFPWKLEAVPGGKACKFTYLDENLVEITKTISASTRPFELDVETKVKNLADVPKRHRFAIEAYAFRRNKEIAGHLGSVSPFVTELSCAAGKEIVRHGKDDFKAGWINVPNTDRYAAISDYYFGKALMPKDGVATECSILAEDWYGEGQARDAEDAAAVYHARLSYPVRELAPQAEAVYRETAFMGPKERSVLKHAADGQKGLSDLINLGFFSPVAKVLVDVLQFFHDHLTFGNWGVAIILMTICLRLALFPLSIKQIRTSFAMRRLKPEVDALSAKFADDPQAKNMAMMELWRKHKVNPLGGCLPQLAQMPVWFAMYTTLQTAVEMYHTRFLWFADLSAPDRFFILPLILGGLMVVQQRLMPQQGMDPMQQKMMQYLLPGVFMVMMLFLPAALGVYMMTNSILGITQQLIVERFAPKAGSAPPGEIGVKPLGKDKASKKPPSSLGKEKASV
jgi:YidC/Oxa1 family membrane protein insertase